MILKDARCRNLKLSETFQVWCFVLRNYVNFNFNVIILILFSKKKTKTKFHSLVTSEFYKQKWDRKEKRKEKLIHENLFY